jgi:hypothetical protein
MFDSHSGYSMIFLSCNRPASPLERLATHPTGQANLAVRIILLAAFPLFLNVLCPVNPQSMSVDLIVQNFLVKSPFPLMNISILNRISQFSIGQFSHSWIKYPHNSGDIPNFPIQGVSENNAQLPKLPFLSVS